MLKKLSAHVWYLPHEEKTDRPVLAYIKGDKLALAVDAGNSPAHTALFYDELEKNGLPLPDLTVITHWHWDHTFALCAVHGVSIACEKTNDKLRAVAKWAWTDAAMKERLETGEDVAMCDECIRAEYPDLSRIRVQPADMSFSGRLDLELGNLACALIACDSPHTRDHVFIHLPADGILIGGDGLCEDCYEGGGAYDKNRLAAYIGAVEAIPFDTFMSGHEAPETRASIVGYLKEEYAKL